MAASMTPDRYEVFHCRVCDSKGPSGIFEAREMMYGLRETFAYAECSACGCLQIVDIPSDLARHYPSDYYSLLPRDEPAKATGVKGWLTRWYARTEFLAPQNAWQARLRALLPVPTDVAEYGDILREARLLHLGDPILDVGCGASPYRLAAFQRCGFNRTEGIDPFIDADRTYHGIPVYKRSIAEHDGQFGLIMFHHSLEHMPDPVAALTQARRLLRPNGTCLVRVPVSGTHLWRRFGVNWVELDAPRHLYLLSVRAMHVLAERAGLRVRAVEFDSGAWEIAASMRYEQGIPLRATPRPIDGFTADQIAEFSRQVAQLNRVHDAGRACFYCEPI